MYGPAPTLRDVERVLAADPDHVYLRLQVAQERAEDLRSRLRELDLLITDGWKLLDHAGVRGPWTPALGPRRPPTLHEAMKIVLEIHDNAWMLTSRLAVEIARRRLYRRRDGMPSTVRDVSARACAYGELFERSAATVRLRGVGYLGDPREPGEPGDLRDLDDPRDLDD